MKFPHKSFYFVRHGETDWNRDHIYMGSKDIPLNLRGIAQAERAAEWLLEEPIDFIVTSPLLRSLKTAEIIASKLYKPIIIMDDLKECSWGVKEGQPIIDKEILENWLEGKGHEGSEHITTFEERVMRAVKEIFELPGIPLIVAHSGTYYCISRGFESPKVTLKNCVPLYHRPPEHETCPWFVGEISEGEDEDLI